MNMNTLLISNTMQNCLLRSLQNNLLRATFESANLIQTRDYAARKGTRERKRKAKVKVEVQKVGFIPHNQRNREKFLASRPKLKFDDSNKRDPVDDVFVMKYYKWVVFPFQEAVQCHRETHSPEMYNKPEAGLHVTIELNMQGEKKTRFVENFTRIAPMPNKFEHGEERTIIAFSKTPENHRIAQDAGAHLSGGVELIKKIQNGQLSLTDFKYVIAHPEILPEMVVLRGLLKRRFPQPKNGTLDVNLEAAVQKFLHGISYTAIKDEYEKDFGTIKTIIGPLTMEPKQLEENFASLIKDVYVVKPKRKGEFITRCILWSPPSPELLKVDHNLYIDSKESSKKEEEEDDDDEEEETKDERVVL